MYTPMVIQDHDLFHAPLTQVLNRFKVSCMAEFDPLLVQIPEEARHFLNPMSMALMAMKMPMGKPAWWRLRVLKKYQSTTALRA
jgi:hypothetical protein